MTLLQLTFILFTVFLLSVGQVLFKMASGNIVLSPSGFLASLLSANFFIALVVYMIATMLWLISLKEVPLRVAYPFAALAFFIVPSLGYFFLGEAVSRNTYIGACIIAVGVVYSVIK